MKGKSYSTEERIYILGALDAGGDIKEVCQENQIAEKTLLRWKRQFGCANPGDTLRREKQEQKNDELKKILINSMVMNRVLEEAYKSRPSSRPR
jgi:transposase-like protein